MNLATINILTPFFLRSFFPCSGLRLWLPNHSSSEPRKSTLGWLALAGTIVAMFAASDGQQARTVVFEPVDR